MYNILYRYINSLVLRIYIYTVDIYRWLSCKFSICAQQHIIHSNKIHTSYKNFIDVMCDVNQVMYSAVYQGTVVLMSHNNACF